VIAAAILASKIFKRVKVEVAIRALEGILVFDFV